MHPTERPTSVMVVEDDPSIGQLVREALDAAGYRAELFINGASATSAFDNLAPDLVLLDAGLPDIDGFTLCRLYRSRRADLPIIMVTARDADIDIVVGLDAGANDYVTKPFSVAVLLARVRAHLRTVVTPDENSALRLGSLTVDPASYLASVEGETIDLRPREFQLLLYLARNAGRVVTRDRLLADIWDVHWDTATKTLDMHILALRRKLGSAIEIATVRGIGYRLVTP